MRSIRSHALIALAAAIPLLLTATSPARADDVLIPSSAQYRGFERHWYLHLPPAPSSHLPLVIALHGGFGFGRQLAKDSGLIAQSDRMGFAVAFPDGWHRHWNDGRNGPNAPGDPDDVAFLTYLAGVLAARHPVIDPARIYLIGVSNGGVMALRVACDATAARHFAGFLAIAASEPVSMAPLCHPSAPLNLVLSQGTADPLMPYAGGLGSRQRIAPRGPVIGQSETARLFTAGSTCRSSAWSRFAASDKALVMTTSCADGTRVSRVKAIGEGHCWPQGAPKGAFRTRISGECHYPFSSANLLRLLWQPPVVRN